MKFFIINSGSSSIKYQVIEMATETVLAPTAPPAPFALDAPAAAPGKAGSLNSRWKP